MNQLGTGFHTILETLFYYGSREIGEKPKYLLPNTSVRGQYQLIMPIKKHRNWLH